MLLFIMSPAIQAKTSVINLRTEYKVNTVGIDVTAPRFSWEIISEERGWMQAAYQIQAAGDPAALSKGNPLVWDTGVVMSDQSTHIVYGGPPLSSGQRIYWRVRVRDINNKTSEWSETAFWEMGLLTESDWQAKWIQSGTTADNQKAGPCPFLMSDIYDGEIYDARLEKPGWDSARYKDDNWLPVMIVDHPKNNLASPPGPAGLGKS